jgi:hypothetical protein
MTIHNDYNESLELDGLEPGEHNPIDTQDQYNPLRYCYLMIATVDEIDYEIAVRFGLQMYGRQTPIDFIDPKTGKPHTVDFFPVMPEIGLEPEQGPEIDTNSGYQIGENTYYLLPTVHRCLRVDTSHLLTREAARHLISPEVLKTAILTYRDKIQEDPNAPTALLELLDTWDPIKQSANWDNEDDWDNI